MKIDWSKDSERILSLIQNNVSYEEIGREYGVTGSYIKKICKSNNILLEKRRIVNSSEHFNKGKRSNKCINCGNEISSNKKYCNSQCYIEHKNKEKVKLWLEHPELFTSEYTYGFIKNYLMLIHKNKCEYCGWGETNKKTGKIPLEVHHIDGDCTNNNITNLQLLCPNCHSIIQGYNDEKESKRYKLKEYKRSLSMSKIKKLIDSFEKTDKIELMEHINNVL